MNLELAFGIGDRAKLPPGTDPKVLKQNLTLDDYKLALDLAERDIVELEEEVDTLTSENQRLRERLDFVERDLALRRQHSNTITYLGAPNGRKSQAE